MIRNIRRIASELRLLLARCEIGWSLMIRSTSH